MTYEEYWIRWCEERTRVYSALARAFEVLGPVMARRQDERLLKLFEENPGP